MNEPTLTFFPALEDSPSPPKRAVCAPSHSARSINSAADSSRNDPPECQTSATSPVQTSDHSPARGYSQRDFLASHSVSPGSAEARAMTVRSGRRCCELLRKPGHVGCLVKTLLESSRWNSTTCFLTWRASVTPSRRHLLFRLVPWTQNTDETEFGLWPTPTSRDHKDGTARSCENVPPNGLLGRVVHLVPTPRSADGEKGIRTPEGAAKERERRKNGEDLPSHVGGSLNPTWVEWLQGYPLGWTEV
jgi:hypothetical protein